MALEYHVINALVEDKPGVLQKVAGLFTRRGFNIDSITVGESEVDFRNSKMPMERKNDTTKRWGRQVEKALERPSAEGILRTVEKMWM